MDFVKNNFVGMADAPESGEEGQGSDEYAYDPVVVFGSSNGRPWGGGLRGLVELNIRAGAILVLLPRADDISLPQRALGGRSGGHRWRSWLPGWKQRR